VARPWLTFFVVVALTVIAPSATAVPLTLPWGAQASPAAAVYDGSDPGLVYGQLREAVEAWRASLGYASDQWGNALTSSYVTAGRPDFVPEPLFQFLLSFYASDLNVLIASNAGQAATWRTELAAAAAAAAAATAAPPPADSSTPTSPAPTSSSSTESTTGPTTPTDTTEAVPNLDTGDTTGTTPNPAPQQPSTTAGATEHELLRLCNEARAAAELAPLAWRDDVANVARTHAADMLKRNYLDHFNPEGQSPFDRLAAANIQFQGAAENVHRATTGAESPAAIARKTFEDYRSSPGHWGNIMSGEFTHAGFGYTIEGAWAYNCQIFTK